MHSESITPIMGHTDKRSLHMYIRGKRCGVVRSTRILTLDHLPASVPWTTYCLRLTPSAITESTLQNFQFGSVPFSHSVVSSSLQTQSVHGLQLPVHHQLPEVTQTHVHQVSDAIQPSHLLLSPSSPAFNLSQH